MLLSPVILIAINIFLSIYAWFNREIYHKWMFNPYRAKENKEYFRFFTSGFIHSNIFHLLLNMAVLLFFGNVMGKIYLENYEETKWLAYLLVFINYLGGVLAANLKTYYRHKSSKN